MPTYIQTTKNQGIFTTSGTVTISAGGTLSDSISLVNRHLISIQVPNGITGAVLTFQFSLDNITFYNAFSLTAELTTASMSALTLYNLSTTSVFHCARYLKIRSGTAAVPVVQPTAKIFTITSIID